MRITYARIRSAEFGAMLQSQKDALMAAYPDHNFLVDVGTSLDLRRPMLLYLLERVCSNEVEEVVVTCKDMLARSGLDLIEWLFARHNTRLLELTPSGNDVVDHEDALEVATFLLARKRPRTASLGLY